MNNLLRDIFDGLLRQLGKDGVVEERVPSFLDLRQGEVTGELYSLVDATQVLGLLYSGDQS